MDLCITHSFSVSVVDVVNYDEASMVPSRLDAVSVVMEIKDLLTCKSSVETHLLQ